MWSADGPPAPGQSNAVAYATKELGQASSFTRGEQEQRGSLPGLLGRIMQFQLHSAPYPNRNIALATAIGLLSGICGRAYNTITGAGLNQYIIVVAKTGRGKEAIADTIGQLLTQVQGRVEAGIPGVPGVAAFRGPGHFASGEGLLKSLAKSPCAVSVIPEFGFKLKAMAHPKAHPVQTGLMAAILDLYGKSGDGKVVEPIAYSDTTKNTAPILSPALTLIGESTPEALFEGIDERVITSGLLPRFLTFEVIGPRPNLNPNVGSAPDPCLVQGLANLVATCLRYKGTATRVPLDAEAEAYFTDLERLATRNINAAPSPIHGELWNRAHLKTLKLASIRAVGINPDFPVVTKADAEWAAGIVGTQTAALIQRFERGDVGEEVGNEAKQRAHVIRVIADYLHRPWHELEKYGGAWRMHEVGVITEAHISRRLITLAAFKGGRGPTENIKATIKTLLDADELREIPRAQMFERFGQKPRAFVPVNPALFASRAV